MTETDRPPPTELTYQRVVLVVAAVVSLVVGLTMFFTGSEDNLWCPTLIRSGLLLAALWWALPDWLANKHKFSPWALVGMLLGCFLVVRRPKETIPMIAALLAIRALLKPRSRS